MIRHCEQMPRECEPSACGLSLRLQALPNSGLAYTASADDRMLLLGTLKLYHIQLILSSSSCRVIVSWSGIQS